MQITVVGAQRAWWHELIGSDRVEVIDLPVPIRHPEDGATTLVFNVDLNTLTEQQIDGVVTMLCAAHSETEAEVRRQLPLNGLAIPAEFCTLDTITRDLVDHLRSLVLPGALKDEVAEAYWTARVILGLFLGEEWIKLHLSGSMDTTPWSTSYFIPDTDSADRNYLHQQRLVDLADSLFMLQDTVGFEAKLRDLRMLKQSAPLEDLAIELALTKNFVISGNKVTFVSRTGTKGRDYDLEVTSKLGHKMAVELKCKRDETSFNIANLRRTLRKAAKQISITAPRVLAIRIPSSWLAGGALHPDCVKLTDSYFSRNFRVSAIIFVWEQMVPLVTGGRAFLVRTLVRQNPQALWRPAYLSELLGPLGGRMSRHGSGMHFSFGSFGG